MGEPKHEIEVVAAIAQRALLAIREVLDETLIPGEPTDQVTVTFNKYECAILVECIDFILKGGARVMGEARRRAEARIDVPLDVRADIATIVQSIKSSAKLEDAKGDPVTLPQPIGGTCWFTNHVGKLALELLGLRVRIEVGGMIYRCGPDPMLDVVAFCGLFNVGTVNEQGRLFAHTWIVQDDDLIDFTPIYWQEASNASTYRLRFNRSSPRWTVKNHPPYFWRPHDALTGPWRNYGTPELGVAWYGPSKQTIGMTPPNELLLVRPHLERYLAELHIKERINDHN